MVQYNALSPLQTFLPLEFQVIEEVILITILIIYSVLRNAEEGFNYLPLDGHFTSLTP